MPTNRGIAERLENRSLLSSTLIPLTDAQAMVEAAGGSTLYISTKSGAIHRFNLDTRMPLQPWQVAPVLAGIDVSPDGKSLYVAEPPHGTYDAPAPGGIHRVALPEGSVSTTPVAPGPAEHLVVTSDKVVFSLDRQGGGIGQLDLTTGTVSQAALPIGGSYQPTLRARSGDRRTIFITDFAGLVYDMTAGAAVSSGGYAPDGTGVGVDGALNHDGTLVASRNHIFDRSLKHVRSLFSESRPIGFDPVRPLFYAVDSVTDHIHAYDTTTWAERFRIPVDEDYEPPPPVPFGRRPTIGAVAADGSNLFITTGSGVRVYSLGVRPEITGVRDDTPAGVPVQVTVTMKDREGRVDAGYTGTIHFGSSDAGAALPEDYTFTPADAGTHTFTVTFAATGAQRLVASDATAHAGDDRATTVDAGAPSATLHTIRQPYDAHTGWSFSIDPVDDRGIDESTFGDDDVVAVSPKGKVLPAKFIGYIEEQYGRKHWPRYSVDPPGGRWGGEDNGVYTIRMAAGGITDLAGNPMPAAAIGSFALGVAGRGAGPGEGGDLYTEFKEQRWPERVGFGKRVKATVVIGNAGNETVRGTVRLVVGATVDGGRTITSLGPSATRDVRVTIPPDRSKNLTMSVPLGNPELSGLRVLLTAHVSWPDGVVDNHPDNDQSVSDSYIDIGDGGVDVGESYAYVYPLNPTERVELRPSAPARVTIGVYNGGTAGARARYLISLFARPNDDLYNQAGERPLATVTKTVSVKPGQERAIAVRVRTPGDLPAGSYWVMPTLTAAP